MPFGAGIDPYTQGTKSRGRCTEETALREPGPGASISSEVKHRERSRRKTSLKTSLTSTTRSLDRYFLRPVLRDGDVKAEVMPMQSTPPQEYSVERSRDCNVHKAGGF